MQNATLWRALLGVEKTVIESIEYDEDEQVLLAAVRPTRRALSRCGRCQRRSPSYDRGEGQRRWRALDLGTTQVWLEAEAPRVQCRTHGPTVAAVPWARHAAAHTRVFDEQVAWLATQCSKTAVTELMRVAWRTVGAIITRVWADVEATTDRFADLRRIGIDEISYKRGHKYLMVVVDHDSRRLVWAAPGRNSATVQEFFDLLGPDRCAQITHVSADGAGFIDSIVAATCPGAGTPRAETRPRKACDVAAATTTPWQRTRPSVEGRAVLAVEEPREPLGEPAGQTRLDRRHGPPVQRTDRVHQHQDPTHHQDRLRIQITRSPHRPRDAQPRRTPTHPPRPDVTHGCVSRARNR